MPGEPPGSSDPPDPDGLVGRAAEAAAIRRMLDGAPLVTVTGLPGVGKTAVSLAAARAAAAGFADGSLLLRLDRLRDEALLPPCPKMQVLATSREPLRVPGKTTVAVRPAE
jgi:predicted ATPase